MPDRVALLAGTTPFHAIPMAALARTLSVECHFFHPQGDLLSTCMGSRLGADALSGGDGARGWRTLVSGPRRLRSLVESGRTVDVYLPHPFHPVLNYLFFSPHVHERHIYEDGILNYYDATVGRVHPQRALNAVTRFVLMRGYRRYEGHISGVDDREVAAGHFLTPECAVRRARFGALHRLQIPADLLRAAPGAGPGDERVLFLDQPLERLVPANVAASMRERAASVAQQFGPVIYKPHHDTGHQQRVPASWAPLSDPDRATPAELLVARHPVRWVVGFFSSALRNIAAMYPGVACFAVGCDALRLTADGKPLAMADLFVRSGVNVIPAADRATGGPTTSTAPPTPRA